MKEKEEEEEKNVIKYKNDVLSFFFFLYTLKCFRYLMVCDW